MAKKNAGENSRAVNLSPPKSSTPLIVSDIPQPIEVNKWGTEIVQDDEHLREGHHRAMMTDAVDQESALAPSEPSLLSPEQPMILAMAEPPMMMAMAEGAAVGTVAGGGAAAGSGLGAGTWLLGGAAVVGGGAWLHSETQHSNDTLYLFPLNTSENALHVVVEKGGAYIDKNANGVLDGDEGCHAAVFSSGGSADLATNHVVVHFNDAPDAAIDLTGFGVDDRIEFDIASMKDHGLINPHNYGLSSNTGLSISLDSTVQFKFSSRGTTATDLTFQQYKNSGSEIGGNYLSSVYALTLSDPYKGNSGFIAFWKDADNALNDWRNLVPDYSGSNTPEVVSHINAGHYSVTQGGVVDFVWQAPVHVVVEAEGAYIDSDADGIHDADETVLASFQGGNADLATNSVVVHFNDVPATAVDLAGFTLNDRIEIDLVAFNDNRMSNNPAMSIVATGYKSSSESSIDDFVWFRMNSGTSHSSFRVNMNTYTTYSGTFGPGLSFLTQWTDGSGVYQLAHWSDTGNPLNDIRNIMPGVGTNSGVRTSGTASAVSRLNQGAGNGAQIDFLWPEQLHVIVERNGAYIDQNANGIVDGYDYCNPANFGVSGGVDLGGTTVTIHFSDLPADALNLTGFGADDKIVFDMHALAGNGMINSSHARLSGLYVDVSSGPYITMSDVAYSGTAGELFVIHQHGFAEWSDFNGNSYGADGGGLYALPYSRVNSRSSGLVAYWSDTGNALNHNSQLIPSYSGGNAGSVLNHINAGTENGSVEFLWPVNVVVDNSGAFIDANGNGILDLGDSCTPADFSNNGNADLSTHSVTIHFNGIPSAPLSLTGFGLDDRIEIDLTVIDGGPHYSRSSLTVMPIRHISYSHSNPMTIGSSITYFYTYRNGIATTSNGRAIFNASTSNYLFLGKTVYSSASSHSHTHFIAGINPSSGPIMNVYSAQIPPSQVLNQVDFLVGAYSP